MAVGVMASWGLGWSPASFGTSAPSGANAAKLNQPGTIILKIPEVSGWWLEYFWKIIAVAQARINPRLLIIAAGAAQPRSLENRSNVGFFFAK